MIKEKKPLGLKIRRDFDRNKYLYLMVIPVIAFFILFHYKSMYGIIIAFQRYRPTAGIDGSPWVGLNNFRRIFTEDYFLIVLRNTLSISVLTLLFSFPAPILLALLINEVRCNKFKRMFQTISYMPHFISLVVVCTLLNTFCSSDGMFNTVVEFFGGERSSMLTRKELFYPIYIGSGIWQSIGWNSIIYLATLAGIDVEQYEAAKVDGANRLQQMIHITLPGLLPTASMLLILQIGSVLSVGSDKILLLYNPATYEVADVIATYIYRKGFAAKDFSYGTAYGLFNSVVNLILLVTANKISKKAGQSGLF